MGKKCLAVGLWVFAGAFSRDLLTWSASQARAGVEPVASRNGDTNGDGSLDISDVAYLLQFLFRGGPAPAEYQLPADVQRELEECRSCREDLWWAREENYNLGEAYDLIHEELGRCQQLLDECRGLPQ